VLTAPGTFNLIHAEVQQDDWDTPIPILFQDHSCPRQQIV
jgi:hypothetical protein